MSKNLIYKERHIIKFADAIVIFIFLIISMVLLRTNISLDTNESVLSAVVYKQNKEIYRMELSKIYKPIEYVVDGDIKVTILFENDGVSVIDSECRDLLCKKHGKISDSADTIVCLPAKVLIKLEENKTNEDIPDAIVK